MKKNLYILFLFVLFSSNAASEKQKKINWNDSNITWFGYEDGIAQIKRTGQPGMLIIYADWCPTCKKYSTLFSNSDVVNATKGLILMRENKDFNIKVSKKFNFDGEYVPRTFALNSKGKVMQKFYSKDEKYTYFIPPSSTGFLVKFAELIKKFGK